MIVQKYGPHIFLSGCCPVHLEHLYVSRDGKGSVIMNAEKEAVLTGGYYLLCTQR